jgi:hypothetical protein
MVLRLEMVMISMLVLIQTQIFIVQVILVILIKVLLYQDLITVLVANLKEITLEANHTEQNQKIFSENNKKKFRI